MTTKMQFAKIARARKNTAAERSARLDRRVALLDEQQLDLVRGGEGGGSTFQGGGGSSGGGGASGHW